MPPEWAASFAYVVVSDSDTTVKVDGLKLTVVNRQTFVDF